MSAWMRWRFHWSWPMTSGCWRWTRPWNSLPPSIRATAELVKLRYFTGMTFEEAASVLGIAVPTAKEWWTYARAWLAVALRPPLEVGGLSALRWFGGVGGEKNV